MSDDEEEDRRPVKPAKRTPFDRKGSRGASGAFDAQHMKELEEDERQFAADMEAAARFQAAKQKKYRDALALDGIATMPVEEIQHLQEVAQAARHETDATVVEADAHGDEAVAELREARDNMAAELGGMTQILTPGAEARLAGIAATQAPQPPRDPGLWPGTPLPPYDPGLWPGATAPPPPRAPRPAGPIRPPGAPGPKGPIPAPPRLGAAAAPAGTPSQGPILRAPPAPPAPPGGPVVPGVPPGPPAPPPLPAQGVINRPGAPPAAGTSLAVQLANRLALQRLQGLGDSVDLTRQEITALKDYMIHVRSMPGPDDQTLSLVFSTLGMSGSQLTPKERIKIDIAADELMSGLTDAQGRIDPAKVQRNKEAIFSRVREMGVQILRERAEIARRKGQTRGKVISRRKDLALIGAAIKDPKLAERLRTKI